MKVQSNTFCYTILAVIKTEVEQEIKNSTKTSKSMCTKFGGILAIKFGGHLAVTPNFFH